MDALNQRENEMDEIDLLEQVVDELRLAEEEEATDMEEFSERYDLLVDCSVDELNDEILKHKLDTEKEGGRFILVKDGKHPVYRSQVLSTYLFIGGEDFTLKRVERGTGKKSAINFVFKPSDSATFSYLVLPYDQAINYMDSPFGHMLAKYLLPAMNSIEQDVIKLQHEFAERHRQREIRLTGDNSEVYSQENSW